MNVHSSFIHSNPKWKWSRDLSVRVLSPELNSSILLQSWVLIDCHLIFRILLENGVKFNKQQGSGESELERRPPVDFCLYFSLEYCPLSCCHIYSVSVHNSCEVLGLTLPLCHCLCLGTGLPPDFELF